MIDCQFHETKRERKKYEDRKQKALKLIVKLADDPDIENLTQRNRNTLAMIWDLVDRI